MSWLPSMLHEAQVHQLAALIYVTNNNVQKSRLAQRACGKIGYVTKKRA